MYETNEETEFLVEEEDNIYNNYGEGYTPSKRTKKKKENDDEWYDKAFEKENGYENEEEYEYDQIGRTKKRSMNVLNKKKLTKKEMDELLK